MIDIGQIAVEGCCHGELDKIYDTIVELEKRDNIKVDLLLCCGDFQVRVHQVVFVIARVTVGNSDSDNNYINTSFILTSPHEQH